MFALFFKSIQHISSKQTLLRLKSTTVADWVQRTAFLNGGWKGRVGFGGSPSASRGMLSIYECTCQLNLSCMPPSVVV